MKKPALKDWLAQRVTALFIALYTVVLLVKFFAAKNISYIGWAGMFAQSWFKLATLLAFLSLLYHAWVGMRDIWMDYIKPTGVRRFLEAFTVIWLIACVGWAVQILWRV